MNPLTDELLAIKQYVLKPDERGAHLRTMVETMAEEDVRNAGLSQEDRDEARQAALEKAAETIAGFIHLAWGGAGTEEYAKRTYGMLLALRDRMRGMNPKATWQYAVTALNVDIQARLRRAEHFVLDSGSETELVHHFFDTLEEYDYLHGLVKNTMHLHWERRHSPDSPAARQPPRRNVPVGPRGSPAVEKHLKQAATEAVATYIVQGNITRDMVESPTDTGLVLRDQIGIQRELGAINEQTWEAAGWKLADFIESSFGTRAGRREAHLARARWRSMARRHAEEQRGK